MDSECHGHVSPPLPVFFTCTLCMFYASVYHIQTSESAFKEIVLGKLVTI